jgi:hypothetical protein
MFFWQGDRMMAVPVSGSREFAAGRAALLFEGRYERPFARPNYDIFPDGRRFVMIKGTEQEPRAHRLNAVLNWPLELARRARSK